MIDLFYEFQNLYSKLNIGMQYYQDVTNEQCVELSSSQNEPNKNICFHFFKSLSFNCSGTEKGYSNKKINREPLREKIPE